MSIYKTSKTYNFTKINISCYKTSKILFVYQNQYFPVIKQVKLIISQRSIFLVIKQVKFYLFTKINIF